MNFKELAWGAFIWANLNKGKPYYYYYENIMNDNEFLQKLKTEPSLAEFEKIRDFLVHFGIHYAPIDLAKKYLSIWSQLRPFITHLSGYKLETCDLSEKENQDAIKRAFSDLIEKVWGGDTVASKVLHLFNPSLFIMWDTDIQIYHQKSGAKGYLEFIRLMQEQAVAVIKSFEQYSIQDSIEKFLSLKLDYQHIRTLAKYIDDYNWVTITKRWPGCIPNWVEALFRK